MFLQGKIQQDHRQLLQYLLELRNCMYLKIQCISNARTQKALKSIFETTESCHAAIGQLCLQEQTYSAPVFALMRTLLESVISILAFCKAPDDRAAMYKNFQAVLRWRLAVLLSRNLGCWLVADTNDQRQKNDTGRAVTASELRNCGIEYLSRRKRSQHCLEKALCEGDESAFRKTWYPESRRELLTDYQVGWTYDVLYTPLCSHVHADTFATQLLTRLDKGNALTLASTLYEFGLWALTERFKELSVSSKQKRFLNLARKKLTAHNPGSSMENADSKG